MTQTPPTHEQDRVTKVDLDCIPSSALPSALAIALRRGRPETYQAIRQELSRRIARSADARMPEWSPTDPVDPLMPIEPDSPSGVSAFFVAQDGSSGVSAFFGTWPGDETDDELLDALKAIG